jgi:hypothetical protein
MDKLAAGRCWRVFEPKFGGVGIAVRTESSRLLNAFGYQVN